MGGAGLRSGRNGARVSIYSYMLIQKHALTSTLTGDEDLAQVALSKVITTGDELIVFCTGLVAGSTFEAKSTAIGGTSTTIPQVNLSSYPYATKGAECAAIVFDLAWANSNLLGGYEFMKAGSRSNSRGVDAAVYFVSGILASSKTDFNDPFKVDATDNPDFVEGTCWKGEYQAGNNPF